jgi:hypothetical protein
MIIDLPLYECKIYFIVLEKNIDIAFKYQHILKKHKIKNNIINKDGAMAGLCIPLFSHYYILVSKEEKNILNTILHELYHLIDFITSDRDIVDAEAKAYLLGYLGSKILKNYV